MNKLINFRRMKYSTFAMVYVPKLFQRVLKIRNYIGKPENNFSLEYINRNISYLAKT
jgi:hypothetical protein